METALTTFLCPGSGTRDGGGETYISLVYKKNKVAGGENKYYLSFDHDLTDPIPDLGRANFTVADMDRDEDEDLFVLGRGREGRVILCLEQRDGSFHRVRGGPWESDQKLPAVRSGDSYTWKQVYSSEYVPYDIDGDGLLDFVTFPHRSDAKIGALINVSE